MTQAKQYNEAYKNGIENNPFFNQNKGKETQDTIESITEKIKDLKDSLALLSNKSEIIATIDKIKELENQLGWLQTARQSLSPVSVPGTISPGVQHFDSSAKGMASKVISDAINKAGGNNLRPDKSIQNGLDFAPIIDEATANAQESFDKMDEMLQSAKENAIQAAGDLVEGIGEALGS